MLIKYFNSVYKKQKIIDNSDNSLGNIIIGLQIRKPFIC